MIRLSSLVRVGLFVVATGLVVGCGGGVKDFPRAKVSGKVTFNKKSVPNGTVTFVSDDGSVTDTATIKDGSYTMERAPVGKVKVGVITAQVSGIQQKQMMQKVEGKSVDQGASKEAHVDVPSKFNNPDSSGVELTVPAEGSSSLDINIGGVGK